MSEKFRNPGPDKIISSNQDASEDLKIHFIKSYLKEASTPERLENERKKTPEEQYFIKKLIWLVEEFIFQHGIVPRFVAEERVKLFEVLPISIEQNEALGGTADTSQRIKIYAEENDFTTIAHHGLHELIHAHSFISMETEVEKIEEDFFAAGMTTRRFGLELNDFKKANNAFKFLNEAITEELTQHIAREEFPKEPIFSSLRLDGNTAYLKERECLNKLVNALYEYNSNAFASNKDVLGLMADAMFTGKVLEFARLIEKTFGKGSFRELGERFAERDPKIDDVLARAHH